MQLDSYGVWVGITTIVEDQATAEPMTSGPSALGPELWFRRGDHRQRLPDWGQWLVNLGHHAARPAEPQTRIVAAIAIPCRAFAAVLCGAGCVTSRDPLRFSPIAPDPSELEAHFQNLCALRPGTTVTVASGKTKHVGHFIRVDDSRGKRHLVIEQTDARKQTFTQYIPLRDAHNVAVRGLGLSCLIIGQVTNLEPEICNGDVTTANGRPLQELLKAKRFADPRDKDIRSDVIASAADLPSGLQDALPAVVIFDGADAFRRWKETWRRSAWVVVLERTARQFDEAVALVEQEFVERRLDDEDPLGNLEVPPGIELMSFRSRMQ